MGDGSGRCFRAAAVRRAASPLENKLSKNQIDDLSLPPRGAIVARALQSNIISCSCKIKYLHDHDYSL